LNEGQKLPFAIECFLRFAPLALYRFAYAFMRFFNLPRLFAL
jgi:hypothetical protein